LPAFSICSNLRWSSSQTAAGTHRHEKRRDPVIAAALEYESATLDALETLTGTDSEAQIAACVRFVDAMQAMDALPDRDRGLTYLIQRGRIPDFAWKRIRAAMEILAADLSSPVH
jgi:hypothetical protein